MRTGSDSLSALEGGFFDYCQPLRQLVETGQVSTPDGDLIQSHASSTVNNLVVLRNLIQKERPSRTLEIGLAHGASALAILATLREVHADSNFQHVAIVPFQTTDWKSIALSQIAEAGLDTNFEFHQEESCLALSEMCRQKRSFDLIYVDGSHLFEDVFLDFFFCSRLLSEGGLVLFDDCRDKHVRKAMKFIETNYSGVLRKESFMSHGLDSLKRKIANWLGSTQLVGFRRIGKPPREWNSRFVNF